MDLDGQIFTIFIGGTCRQSQSPPQWSYKTCFPLLTKGIVVSEFSGVQLAQFRARGYLWHDL